MATKTFEELKQMAIQIRDEKTNKQNTATRIGTQMLEHLNKLEQEYYDKTTLDKRVTELNISELYKTQGIGGTNRYTLEGAIAQVEEKYRVQGVKVTFVNESGDTESWEYKGTTWAVGSFSEIGANKISELENSVAKSFLKNNSVLTTLIPKQYFKKDGTTFSHPRGNRTDLIPYTSDMILSYSGQYGASAVGVVFFNSSKEFIGYQFENESYITVYNQEIKPIEGTAYIASCSISDEVFELNDENITDTAKELKEELKNGIDKNTEDINKNAASILELSSKIPMIDESFQYTEKNYTNSTNKESSVFCTAFSSENMPTTVNITHINYKALNVFENNKIFILDILEGETKVQISKIIDIPDAIEGINSIDVDFEISNNQLLAILGNDTFVNTTSSIPYVKQIWSIGSVTSLLEKQIGDTISIGQKLRYCKAIEIIGIEYKYINTEIINELIEKKVINEETINTLIEQKVAETIKDKSNNYLNGKILSVTGDSEAAGHSIGRDNTYGKLIADRNSMTLYNTAVNGRKLAYVEDSPGSGTPLVQAIDEINEDTDYILCHIGYNDVFDEAEEDDSKDITKYKGAFNTVIEGWQSRCPKARIGIIIPYYFNGETSRIKRAEWMKKRCEFYHIQSIDGTINSGLRKDCSEQAEYFIDAVHLTALGHERVSYIYEQFLRGL